MTTRSSAGYPRPGERIAPNTLREALTDPIPSRLRGDPDSTPLSLCDLDEHAWETIPAETLVELSRIVIDRVSAYRFPKVLQNRLLPGPPEGARLEDIGLDNRTRRCLAREGFEDHLESLGDYTIGEIMSIRAFGVRCLVDLLAALESPALELRKRKISEAATEAAARTAKSSEELTAAAESLAELPDAELAWCEDPRLAGLMRAVGIEANTAADLAERLICRTQDPPDAPYTTEQVRKLHDVIDGMSDLTLEEELIQIFGNMKLQRNRQILISYYGWEDGRQHTLTEIGKLFGITRERVRQVCAKTTKRPKNLPAILAPVMDRALKFIQKQLPGSAADIEAKLAEEGLTAVGMCLEGVTTGAKLLDRHVTFKLEEIDNGRLAVRPEQSNAASMITNLARKAAYFRGLTTVDRIAEKASQKYPNDVGPKLVRETLLLIDGFSWLSEKDGWFRLASITGQGLPKAIDKILSVAGKLTISEMRTAMSRNRRLWKDPPPEKVMLEFCRQMPGVRVEGKRIISDAPRDWRKLLSGVEATIVAVLKEHGPIMERGDMEDLCVAAGMNRFSFHAFVSWSVAVTQLDNSIYALLGTKVSRKRVDALIAKRRARRSMRRVLNNYGRTRDGRIWLSYTLSRSASTFAVITIPTALKAMVSGRFKLLTDDGQKVGTLATQDGRAWGLGVFMRQRGAQAGDNIVVTLDLNSRTAVVSMGKEPPE